MTFCIGNMEDCSGRHLEIYYDTIITVCIFIHMYTARFNQCINIYA